MDRRAIPRIAAALLLVSFAAEPAEVAGDAANGRKLAYTCMGCHGIEHYRNAYPNYPVPKLAGQNAAYIIAALGQYDAGNRWHPTMRGLANSLTAKERADLAAYFASLAPAPQSKDPVGTPPEQAEACVACHGRNGQGTMDEYPHLSGQHAGYLAQALNDYRRGRRKNPLMQPFAQQLSQQDIQVLAKFFSQQKGLGTLRHE